MFIGIAIQSNPLIITSKPFKEIQTAHISSSKNAVENLNPKNIFSPYHRL